MERSLAFPRRLMSCRLVGLWFFAATCGSAAVEDDGVCEAGQDGCGQADVVEGTKSLRWRFRTYHRDRREELYGGAYVKEAFSTRFQGPAVDDDWDVLWTHSPEVAELIKAKLPSRPGRLALQCRYFRAAGQKCYFAGHVRRVAAALEKQRKGASEEFTYLRNYVLTNEEQFKQWSEEALANPRKTWVVKECSVGASQGVKLLRDEALVKEAKGPKPKDWVVAQEYVERPYMGFGGSKFHLRIYVLITSWGPPPRVFVYNEGIIFKSRSKYDPENLSHERDVFSTWSSGVEAVTHTDFWKFLDEEAESKGGQHPGSAEVRGRILKQIQWLFGLALEESFGSAIKETQPDKVGFRCFDIVGLDVMLDVDLNPLVLEINSGPNMNIHDRARDTSDLLGRVKKPMISQVVHWSELYVRQSPKAGFDPKDIEDLALVNFTRAL